MRRPKKFQSGEAVQYITRRAALRKLQLSLNDFRRLCIIKGVYPREPKHRRRAQKGSSDIKILYHAKDIRFLLHEPIVWTLRGYKIFAKKTGRDRAIKDFRNMKRRLALFPELKIDHIVKERYPTFIDAIKDLDDCLTLIFLFSTFPSLRLIPREQSALCRRLTVEFLHYIITSKSLRKVFISIKGYYFQADIKGQKVTWIIPHYYPFKPHTKVEVDFKVMSIFIEFYAIMFGFVNFRLYHGINLSYPPELPAGLSATQDIDEVSFVSDRIAALNYDLKHTDQFKELEESPDMDLDLLEQDSDSKQVLKMKRKLEEVKRLETLFKGLKFFISREVPREPLVVIIRSFGGKISWDSTVFAGATFDESDETITHQITDRTSIEKQYISRDYVQPQWIFDSVNQRSLLPTSNYFVGVVLPPHLSPFADDKQLYKPTEEKAVNEPFLAETHDIEVEGSDNLKSIEDLDTQLQAAYEKETIEVQQYERNDMNEDEADDLDPTELDKKKKQQREIKNMAVETGKVHKDNKRLLHKTAVEEHRLQARMVKPRHRNLFRKLIREKQAKEKEEWLLRKKRRIIDSQSKKETSVKLAVRKAASAAIATGQ